VLLSQSAAFYTPQKQRDYLQTPVLTKLTKGRSLYKSLTAVLHELFITFVAQNK